MSIQLVCALVVPLAVWEQLRHDTLLLWAGAIATLAALSFRAWWHSRQAPPRRTASARSLRRVILHAVLLGSLWGLLPLMSYDLTDTESRYFIGMLVTGMVCAGGFALAAVPVAGTLFVAIVGSGATVALALRGGSLAPVFALQLGGYSVIVIYTVWGIGPHDGRTHGGRSQGIAPERCDLAAAQGFRGPDHGSPVGA